MSKSKEFQKQLDAFVEEKGESIIEKLTEFCKKNNITGDSLTLLFLGQGIRVGAEWQKEKADELAEALEFAVDNGCVWVHGKAINEALKEYRGEK